MNLEKSNELKIEQQESTRNKYESFMQQGWKQYNEKDFLGAAKAFQQAVKLQPSDIDGLYALGMSLRYGGNDDLATKVFREVIRLTDNLENGTRGRIIRRLALGHINQIGSGDWNLETSTWTHNR